jgi:hypothetical protein
MFRLDSPKDKPQIAVGWNPPMVGDFHKLDRFGEIVFGDEKGQASTAKAEVAKGDKVEKKDDKKDEKASKGEKPAKKDPKKTEKK